MELRTPNVTDAVLLASRALVGVAARSLVEVEGHRLDDVRDGDPTSYIRRLFAIARVLIARLAVLAGDRFLVSVPFGRPIWGGFVPKIGCHSCAPLL